MDKLIVFLGNPGREYEKTRHNIAWQLLEQLPFFSQLHLSKKFNALFALTKIDANNIGILLPQTYMNLSGNAVRACCDFYKFDVKEMLVVHDELDLEFGKVSFKFGGGDAGHNGLKSITASMSTPNYHRYRMGIGRPVHGSTSDWVLSNFSKDESIMLDRYFQESYKALEVYLKEGPQKAASKYNKRILVE